ncbi:MAG TPA: hypothetical protein VFP58_04745 [Candidatus Eisenbacteria bacterium]|nr:hypothetical protein [Candidatus Eisenbacteria bacterium]
MDERQGFRWTERRVARFVTMILSGAVVLADIYLFFMVSRMPAEGMAGWKPMILAGVIAVFLFATYRFRRQLRLFRAGE